MLIEPLRAKIHFQFPLLYLCRSHLIRPAPISTLSGAGELGFADGNSTHAQFRNPWGVAISSDGVFALVVDFNNARVRRVTMATGIVTTLAGSGTTSSVDGIGALATFSNPTGVSISRDTSFALVTDWWSHRVRRIEIATGAVTTLAGSSAGYADGAGTSALFNGPYGVAISPDANFALVADRNNDRVRRLNIATGTVTMLAGSTRGYADATGTSAMFFMPEAIAISPDGTFALVTDSGNFRVRRLEIATGVVTTLAGSASAGSTDGASTSASFNSLFGVAISPDASYALVTNGGSNRLRHIALASGFVTTLAGSLPGFADGVGSSALFNSPRGVAIAPDGASALIVEFGNSRVRRAALASPCQPGTYCPAASTNYTQCPAGSFCANASTIETCSPGEYCPARSTATSLCAAGAYCTTPATQAPCTAGLYCHASGLSAPSGNCSAGFHCDEGSSTPTQYACAIGTYCPIGSANATACALGSYCPSASLQIACPAGTSCNATGLTDLSSAVPCAPMTFSLAGASACLPCAAGAYSLGHASTCVSCGACAGTRTMISSVLV